ncbi:hypothetical protein ES703_13262 [subsurface metagenome]
MEVNQNSTRPRAARNPLTSSFVEAESLEAADCQSTVRRLIKKGFGSGALGGTGEVIPPERLISNR